ncbi:MAG: hypothetical protein LBG11_05050 [Bifidobacteriaceae bacterium]|nr:hypothetical protein [Bifidobacteriaceae bacterium]
MEGANDSARRVAEPTGPRTARVVEDEHGDLVARSDTVVTDKMMYALLDAGRK